MIRKQTYEAEPRGWADGRTERLPDGTGRAASAERGYAFTGYLMPTT